MQARARSSNTDHVDIAAKRQNAEAWYKVMAQEMAALVEPDYRNSNKPWATGDTDRGALATADAPPQRSSTRRIAWR